MKKDLNNHIFRSTIRRKEDEKSECNSPVRKSTAFWLKVALKWAGLNREKYVYVILTA